MSTSEIAKLESRWRENRQGLSFAPLAEAYRKMGDPGRALEVLGEGLAVNPNYIPASIVLGRCHLDLGDDANAETAFRHVLELDNENVIALRSLADIAERGGRIGEARGLLRDLLTIDRGNDDARAQLAALESASGSTDVADETAEVTDSSEVEAGLASPEHEVVGLDTVSNAPAEPWDDDAPSEPPSEEPFDADSDSPVSSISSAPSVDPSAPSMDPSGQSVDDDWIPDPEPFTPEPVDRDESIQLQEHLTPQQDVAPLDDLVVDDAPQISDESAQADTMDGLVGQDFAEQGAEVEPLEDLKTGAGSLTEFDDLERSTELELRPSDTNEFQVASAAEELAAASVEQDDGDDDWITSAEPPEDFPALESPEAPVVPAESTAGPFDTVSGSFGADALGAGNAPSAEAGQEGSGFDEDELLDEDEPLLESADPVAALGALGEGIELESADEADEPDGASGSDWGEEAGDGGMPELVVTESMADLYLRQGHRKEALAVYRLLYQRSPDDLRLRERVDELETEVAAEVSGADVPPSVVSLAAVDAGRTVSALFRTVLGAALPEPTGNWERAVAPAPRPLAQEQLERAPEAAAPTRPAGDHLSLSDVFGEDSSPVPPAVPVARSVAEGDVSFDSFFGENAGEQAHSRAPARDDDDLDQFHTWLQNLKR
ncbi:MAG TPA: tetratricopeptide repeat protein [Gemmatimonadales bacterium]|nr:tetratricopeptide repeat protein [Gemmatimonadales bacterium]